MKKLLCLDICEICAKTAVPEADLQKNPGFRTFLTAAGRKTRKKGRRNTLASPFRRTASASPVAAGPPHGSKPVPFHRTKPIRLTGQNQSASPVAAVRLTGQPASPVKTNSLCRSQPIRLANRSRPAMQAKIASASKAKTNSPHQPQPARLAGRPASPGAFSRSGKNV